VIDRDGRPVPGARIEVWRCDAFGVYHHPRDPRGPADPNFQGFGATTAAADGGYRFRTIEPVPYPGRTPHIHVKVKRGDRALLTTQCYVKGEPGNERDGLLRGIRDARARESVIVDFAPMPGSRAGELAAKFDIVLGVTPDGL
jgi:protocatechuate 3,4-dioxygenase beta subunit